MSYITIQCTVSKKLIPTTTLLKHWAKHTLAQLEQEAELNIRVVDLEEMTALNTQYRHKTGPTNVLSFCFDMPEDIIEEPRFLGDIVICAEIVNREATTQGKSMQAHWAHMVVHGTLHLLGYDHETEDDAAVMEPKEAAILQTLGFDNPYLTEEK